VINSNLGPILHR